MSRERPTRAVTSSTLQALGYAGACVSYPINHMSAPMNPAPAPARITQPDPDALACAIIYFKEKIEYAVESFEGSAAYNQNQAARSCGLNVLLNVVTLILLVLGMVAHSRHWTVFTALQVFAIITNLVGLVLVVWVRSRDFRSCWAAHASAFLRMKRIESRVKLVENSLGISEKNLEEFYGEYRSVYEDTNGVLNASGVS